MADYGFSAHGKVYTPNGTPGISPEENDARNRAIEQAELARWKERPERFVAYYAFPAEQGGGLYRSDFRPCLHNNMIPRDSIATVSTWTGAKLGVIISARVTPHNFGGRMVSLVVRGTNGAFYYGRASWDNGSVIKLRRRKG